MPQTRLDEINDRVGSGRQIIYVFLLAITPTMSTLQDGEGDVED